MKTPTIAHIPYQFVILTLVFLLLAMMSVNAQKLQLGVVAGVTASQLSGQAPAISGTTLIKDGTQFAIAPTAGLFAEVPLPFSTSVRVGAMYTQKGGLSQQVQQSGQTQTNSSTQQRLNYLEVPVTFNYHLMDRIRLSAGAYAAMLHSGTFTYSKEILEGSILTEAQELFKDPKDLYKQLDYGLQAGAGVRLTNNVSVDLAYKYGLPDITQTPSLASLKQHNSTLMLGLSVGFR